MQRRFGFGMIIAVGLALLAGPALASNCGYPARTAFSLDKFEQYGGAAVQKIGLSYDARQLRSAIAEDMTQVAEYRADFTTEERTAFFNKAEAGINRRVMLLKTLANHAHEAGVTADAVAWLTNHVDALQTCGESARRTVTGAQLAILAEEANLYRYDAVVVAILDSLPQACNDTLLDTVANPMAMPEAGSFDAYDVCAAALVRTASRDNPDHFIVHHRLADPACELMTRVMALMRGSEPVALLPKTTGL